MIHKFTFDRCAASWSKCAKSCRICGSRRNSQIFARIEFRGILMGYRLESRLNNLARDVPWI